jgi:16S rRNA (guanine(966)-N(2))-methyltransferase RsmD
MRIIAGKAKGRTIKTRKGMDTRPTLDRVKESLFGILDPYINDARFLDLFSGSGSIGLEALSRGAKKCVMIEKDSEALKYIIENINNLGFDSISRAYKNDVERAVEILGKKREKFDIIFMDPPYRDEVCSKVIKAIKKAGILDEKGLIICEHHIAEKMPEELHGYKKTDERIYKTKVMTFYTE